MKDYMSDQQFVKPLLFELLVEDLLDTFLVTAVFAFFGEFKPDKEPEKYLEVIERILAMLEASKSILDHGPCIPFVEGLMKARGDFDRTAASGVMEAIKRKVKEEGLTDRTHPIQFHVHLCDVHVYL
ncbi:hypothetical protein L210DRAFT_3548948, partial [Boletus edulis BED1]